MWERVKKTRIGVRRGKKEQGGVWVGKYGRYGKEVSSIAAIDASSQRWTAMAENRDEHDEKENKIIFNEVFPNTYINKLYPRVSS